MQLTPLVVFAGLLAFGAGKRSKWNRDDFDAAVREYERLTGQPS